MSSFELSQNVESQSLFGTTGAHVLGTGLGAALTGAVVGSVGAVIAGPVGAVAGAAVGAFIGGLAGKAAEEYVDPETEYSYWEAHFRERPYVPAGASFEMYRSAYQFGWPMA